MNATHWWAPIDAYCERTDATFWSEPVNALSNAAFLVAALLAFRGWRVAGGRDWPALALIGVVAAIGVGSFLFHTFANRWSLVADVLPITVFIYGYFALAMARFFRLGLVATVLATVGFGLFNTGFVKTWKAVAGTSGIDWTNGSVGYFPAALAMLAVGALLLSRGRREAAGGVKHAASRKAGGEVLFGAGAFVASLFFRSVDLAACEQAAVGTHFLWHVLNAVVLGALLKAAIGFSAACGLEAAKAKAYAGL